MNTWKALLSFRVIFAVHFITRVSSITLVFFIKEKPERVRAGVPAPGRAGPFIYSHGEDQALTGSDTCYWQICSPSVNYRLLFFSGQEDWETIVLPSSDSQGILGLLGTCRKQCVIHATFKKWTAYS